jgi:MFS transporter, putative metabolite:H+ symporter
VPAGVVNSGGRLDRLPISSFHYRVLGLVSGGMFLDAFEIYLAGGVLAALVKSGWSDLSHNAWFISITFAGMVVGSWCAGIFGDHFGRRFSYQLNLLIFGFAALAGAAAPSIEWLIAARFVMGVGLGAEIVVGYVTLSEFVPPQQRGRWGSALSAITNSALFFSSVIGLLIIPDFGWRWMFVITGVGALIVWYLRRGLPESPRWLESKGHFDEAEKVLSAIEAEVSRRGPLPPAVEQPTPVLPRQSIKALFEGEMLARTIVGSIILIAINTVIYGFVAWVPTFLVKQGMSVVSSLGFTTLMSLGGPVGALAGMWLGDHVGRKPVLVGFSLATIVLGFIYPFAPSEALLSLAGFALVTCVYVMVAVAWGLYVPELFPTEIRMRGAGFCNTMGRLMTIVTPQIVPVIFLSAGVIGVVGLLSALLLIQAVAVALFGIETRQQSLEALRPQQSEGEAIALETALPRSPQT